LAKDWRQQSDIAWRTTTWDLRRMAAGGMVLQDATAEERRAARLSDDTLALRVNHVGEYGDHAVAKRAGFKKDDILVGVDGQNSHLAESELFRYLLQHKMPGEKIPVTVLRDGERMNLELLMQ
jgi:S1-C subfamily serine protease